jgi:glycosyltransferase involved in cell wall biosynthesis
LRGVIYKQVSMKILYVKDRYTVHDRRFVEAIVAQGHVPIAVQADGDETVGTYPGVPVRRISVEDLPAIVAREGIEVVHAGPVPFAARIAKNLPLKLPLVVVCWGSDILLDCAQDIHLRAQAVTALERASVVLVDCQAVAQTIATWLPDLSAAVISFPWGLDLPRFEVLPTAVSHEMRKSLGWLNNDVFVSTRSWENNYGIQSLVAAFALVVKRVPTARLLLVGDGSLRPEIMGMVASLGLLDHIRTPGRVDEHELPVMVGAADVYVSSSYCDGTSISLLEAMVSGKPVIGHNEFGNLDWVLPDENGWLVDCHDPAKLADSILVSLEARNRWPSMGLLGRKRVFERADWGRNSLRLSEAYHQARERTGS